ncbi:MAG: TVP38/TMEM64 family protein [Phycisphaerales bacterium]
MTDDPQNSMAPDPRIPASNGTEPNPSTIVQGDRWVSRPHPVLRVIGWIGVALYLPLALVLFLWTKGTTEFQDAFVEKITQPDEILFFFIFVLVGASLMSVAIVSEIGRERIHKAWDVLRAMGPTAILGVMWTVSPGVLGILLVWYLGPISIWLRELGAAGWFVYVALFIFSAGVGFLPTYGQSLLGGWVFGFLWGFPGAMLGFVGGSVIGYFIAKRVSKHKVEEILKSNPKARAASEALVGHGFWRTLGIVTLIRIPPNSPFAITNLVLASSGVGFLPYLLGTAIGMAPRTAITCLFAALGAQQGQASIVSLIRHTNPLFTLAGVVLLFGVLYVLYIIAEKAIQSVTVTKPEGAVALPQNEVQV